MNLKQTVEGAGLRTAATTRYFEDLERRLLSGARSPYSLPVWVARELRRSRRDEPRYTAMRQLARRRRKWGFK